MIFFFRSPPRGPVKGPAHERRILKRDSAMKHAPKGPNKAHGDPIEPSHPMKAFEPCTATNRQGKRCGRRPIPGGRVCWLHGGAAPQVQASAAERLRALQPKAIVVLETLLNRDEFPTVQMAAVRDVLDRTEGKAADSLRVMGDEGGPIRHTFSWQEPSKH